MISLLYLSLISLSVNAQSSGDLQWTFFPSSAIAGTQYPLRWTASDTATPVSIYLRQGDTALLTYVSTILNTSTGDSYPWTPTTDLLDGSDYYLHLAQGSLSSFSTRINITGGLESATTSIMTPTSTPSSTFTQPAETSSTSSSPVNSNNNESRTSKLALIISLCLGIPFLLSLLANIYLLLKLRNARSRHTSALAAALATRSSKSEDSCAFPRYNELVAKPDAAELPGSDDYYFLSGRPVEMHSPIVETAGGSSETRGGEQDRTDISPISIPDGDEQRRESSVGAVVSPISSDGERTFGRLR